MFSRLNIKDLKSYQAGSCPIVILCDTTTQLTLTKKEKKSGHL